MLWAPISVAPNSWSPCGCLIANTHWGWHCICNIAITSLYNPSCWIIFCNLWLFCGLIHLCCVWSPPSAPTCWYRLMCFMFFTACMLADCMCHLILFKIWIWCGWLHTAETGLDIHHLHMILLLAHRVPAAYIGLWFGSLAVRVDLVLEVHDCPEEILQYNLFCCFHLTANAM